MRARPKSRSILSCTLTQLHSRTAARGRATHSMLALLQLSALNAITHQGTAATVLRRGSEAGALFRAPPPLGAGGSQAELTPVRADELHSNSSARAAAGGHVTHLSFYDYAPGEQARRLVHCAARCGSENSIFAAGCAGQESYIFQSTPQQSLL